MTVSLCMIVKDEADTLLNCLQSVQGCVDEMIVVDTGSQDDTIAIAQQLGAQVDRIEWIQDFAAARNDSLAKATGDWVLVLDADETLTAAGRQLLNAIRTGAFLGRYAVDSTLLFTLLRHEVNAAQSPYSAVSRLFRNRSDIRFQRPYHETVDDSVMAVVAAEPDWQVVDWPEVAIEHTGYEASAITQRDKFTRAKTIMTAYLETHPEDAYICNKLGALYGASGDWETGRALLQQGLEHMQADPQTAYELHYHLGLAHRETGQLAVATKHYQVAIAQPIPDRLKVGAYINLGSLRQAQQDFAEAVAHFKKAITVTPEFAIAHFNLGTAHRAQGNLGAAIAAYQTAIALQPNYAAAYQNLGVALFKIGQLPESLKAFEQAITLYEQTDVATAQRLRQGIRNLMRP